MDMAHEEPNYMAIFYWLFGLTVAELAVSYTPMPKGLMIAALVSLAFVKASLVAMYFMHLKFEKRTLAMIALTPPMLLVMFLFITYPDTAWRLFTQWAAH
jgi:cytochrome c oxidase subunit 4